MRVLCLCFKGKLVFARGRKFQWRTTWSGYKLSSSLAPLWVTQGKRESEKERRRDRLKWFASRNNPQTFCSLCQSTFTRSLATVVSCHALLPPPIFWLASHFLLLVDVCMCVFETVVSSWKRTSFEHVETGNISTDHISTALSWVNFDLAHAVCLSPPFSLSCELVFETRKPLSCCAFVFCPIVAVLHHF